MTCQSVRTHSGLQRALSFPVGANSADTTPSFAEMRLFAVELLLDVAKSSKTKPQDIADVVKVVPRVQHRDFVAMLWPCLLLICCQTSFESKFGSGWQVPPHAQLSSPLGWSNARHGLLRAEQRTCIGRCRTRLRFQRALSQKKMGERSPIPLSKPLLSSVSR